MSFDANNDPASPRHPPRRSVLFVCTGNTCRSPLAEGLCKKLLADRLGVPADDLPRHGYVIRSAGVSASPGDAASPEGVEAAARYGVDLSAHRSRPVNPELLAEATDVVAMTGGHLAVLMIRHAGHGPEPTLLAAGEDIPDPIGGDRTEYDACAATIVAHLTRLIAEWTRT